ncbi:MAG: hypothetical protein ABH848_05900 [Candidatus Omnitrophota bacterium]
MKIVLTLFLTIGILFSHPVYSEEVSLAFMKEEEARSGEYVFKETLEKRSTYSSSIKRFLSNGRTYYKFIENGQGDYDIYKDITWENIARLEEIDNSLYPIYSTQVIKDKDGKIIIEYKKLFDYDKNKIFYTAKDSSGNIIKENTFPIKGKTADNVTLSYFLRTYIANRGNKKDRSFYLLSSEPKLYRINLKFYKTEVIKLPFGEKEAVKVRLIPDLGILSGLVGAFIPPTYMWFKDVSPHNWLKYEGLETGLGSSVIITHITSAYIE